MSILDFGYGGDAGFTNLGLLGSDSVSWTFEEDKFFEMSLAQYEGSWPIMGDDYWSRLQEKMPQKGVQDLKDRFTKLEEDVRAIESGLVPLPDYEDECDDVTAEVTFDFAPTKPVKVQAPAPAPARLSSGAGSPGCQKVQACPQDGRTRTS